MARAEGDRAGWSGEAEEIDVGVGWDPLSSSVYVRLFRFKLLFDNSGHKTDCAEKWEILAPAVKTVASRPSANFTIGNTMLLLLYGRRANLRCLELRL